MYTFIHYIKSRVESYLGLSWKRYSSMIDFKQPGGHMIGFPVVALWNLFKAFCVYKERFIFYTTSLNKAP